MEMSRIFTIFS